MRVPLDDAEPNLNPTIQRDHARRALASLASFTSGVGLGLVGLGFVGPLGCKGEGPEYEVGWVTARLKAAGYEVSPPTSDPGSAHIKQVVKGECLEATKEGKVDRLCILHCTTRTSCRPTRTERGPLGESFGTMERGATVLVHRACGYRDCGAAREAIGR